jgi:nucleoside-diphosphate-sugar epimerase
MKIIIITGGAGNKGKELIKKLSTQNDVMEIIVLDNFASSSITDFDEFILNTSTEKFKIKLYEFNLVHSNMINFITERYIHVDSIYHLASNSINTPLEILELGYTGTKNILELVKYYKSEFFYIQNTNYTVNSNSLYFTTSKLTSEALYHAYKKQFGININKV